MAWPYSTTAGFAHKFGFNINGSNNGGTASGTTSGQAWVTPFYIPVNRSYELTKTWVKNADTVSDANLVIRVGLYEIISDLTLVLLNDFGTIAKDTTAITALRQVGSNFSRTIGPDKLYATVSLTEVVKVGATLGYDSVSGAEWGWNPWGTIGNNTPEDIITVGNGSGSSGASQSYIGLASGGLPSTLGYPTPVAGSTRGVQVWYTVATETVI